MYKLNFTEPFEKNYLKLLRKERTLIKKVDKVLKHLQENPFYPSLKSHKTDTRNYGIRWSSWVTGDIRIIWDFDEERILTIILLDIGKHSGSKKIYK
ncbi:hypothetical protein HY612_02170 [Candidatus Roizmanbacteria bacterium]|nr:hypothetical protein [Candidatus Roizmanbacteria bacterium]